MSLTQRVIAEALKLGLREENLIAGIKNEGNTARLEAFFKRAQMGNSLKVGYFGGSVTEGANSTDGKCYAKNVTLWLRDSFNKSDFRYINAGKGATGSLVGCHRMDEELLKHNPDLIFIDFSVNDALEQLRDGVAATESYEGVVRKALASGAAVVILSVCNSEKLTLQDLHHKIAEHYGVPLISMVDGIYPLIESGKMQWSDYSNDGVHPINYGHSLISCLITYYLSRVTENPKGERVFDLPEPLYSDVFQNAQMWDFYGFSPEEKGDFTVFNSFHQFMNGWESKGDKPLKFTLKNTREIHFIIHYSPDEALGGATVSANEQEAYVSCFFEKGWGEKALAVKVYLSPEPQNVTVTVTPEKGKAFRILRICKA